MRAPWWCRRGERRAKAAGRASAPQGADRAGGCGLSGDQGAGWGAAAQTRAASRRLGQPATRAATRPRTARGRRSGRRSARPAASATRPARVRSTARASGDGHLDDHPDRQEVTIQQRLDRDAGLQPLQHLLHQIDRELEAGQLGGQAPDRLARLGPGPVAARPGTGATRCWPARPGPAPPRPRSPPSSRRARWPPTTPPGPMARDGQQVGEHVPDHRPGHRHTGQRKSRGQPPPPHGPSIGGQRPRVTSRPIRTTDPTTARTQALAGQPDGRWGPSVTPGLRRRRVRLAELGKHHGGHAADAEDPEQVPGAR